MLSVCPQCGTRVLPTATGQCPACRAMINAGEWQPAPTESTPKHTLSPPASRGPSARPTVILFIAAFAVWLTGFSLTRYLLDSAPRDLVGHAERLYWAFITSNG